MDRHGVESISLDRGRTITPSVTFSGREASAYRALSSAKRQRLCERLRDRHGARAVDTVLGPLYDWKKSSYANYAKTHELLFRAANDIDAPARNGDLLGVDPTADQRAVATALCEVSRRFTDRHFSSRIDIYRGLRHLTPALFLDIAANPTQMEHDLDWMAVTNFTTDRVVAESYGQIVLGVTVPTEQLLLAVDYLFPYVVGGDVRHADAEVRVDGSAIPPVSTDRLLLPGTRTELREAIHNPSNARWTDHDRIAEIIRTCCERGLGVSDEDAAETLWEWFDAYRAGADAADRQRLGAVETYIRELTGHTG
jgi:hypothetical protein